MKKVDLDQDVAIWQEKQDDEEWMEGEEVDERSENVEVIDDFLCDDFEFIGSPSSLKGKFSDLGNNSCRSTKAREDIDILKDDMTQS